MSVLQSDAVLWCRERLDLRAAAVGALVAVVLTLLFDTFVASFVSPILDSVNAPLAVGISLVMVLLFRAMAGVLVARVMRGRRTIFERGEYLPSAVVAGLVGAAVYQLFAAGVAQLVGTPAPVGRMLLELPRWAVEVGLGALMVDPTTMEQSRSFGARLQRERMRR